MFSSNTPHWKRYPQEKKRRKANGRVRIRQCGCSDIYKVDFSQKYSKLIQTRGRNQKVFSFYLYVGSRALTQVIRLVQHCLLLLSHLPSLLYVCWVISPASTMPAGHLTSTTHFKTTVYQEGTTCVNRSGLDIGTLNFRKPILIKIRWYTDITVINLNMLL